MNQCNECKFYSGDQNKGMCFVVPPKINLAIVCGDWTEEQLQDASVRPVVMADDLACTFFCRHTKATTYLAPISSPGALDW